MRFASESFKMYFAEHHCCNHLEMPPYIVQGNLLSLWNCNLVQLDRAAFTKPLLVETEKRAMEIHTIQRSPGVSWPRLPELTRGHTLADLRGVGDAFSCDNWKLHRLNDRTGNSVKGLLSFFHARTDANFQFWCLFWGPKTRLLVNVLYSKLIMLTPGYSH